MNRPKIGLLLPIGCDPFQVDNEIHCLKSLIEVGLESIWVRDLPVSSSLDGDEGSWFDPFVYLGQLSELARTSSCKIGTAVLCASFRSEYVLSKAIASLQLLSKGNFIAGLGAGEKEVIFNALRIEWSTRSNKLMESCSAIYRLLHKQGSKLENVNFRLPEDFIAPPLHIASSNTDIWKQVGQFADGWMTWFQTPKALRSKYDAINEVIQKRIDVSMTINLSIDDCEDTKLHVKQVGGLNVLCTGIKEFPKLCETYSALGVDRLIVNFVDMDNHQFGIPKLMSLFRSYEGGK